MFQRKEICFGIEPILSFVKEYGQYPIVSTGGGTLVFTTDMLILEKLDFVRQGSNYFL
jgi:hypothetical protein